MGDLVSDGTGFSCTFCASQLKISVPSSSAEGDSKKLASTGNFLFPPPPGAQCLLIPNAPTPCAPPSVSVMTPGQSALEIDGKTALGAGCKLQCAKGGLLSVASSGQSSAQHGGAQAGPTASISAAATAAIGPALAANDDSVDPPQQEKKRFKKGNQDGLSSRQRSRENRQRDGTPGPNNVQNAEFKAAVKKIEKNIDKKLSKDEVTRLHRRISKEGLDFHGIVDEGTTMYGEG
ncbi:MAG TPA: PAAR-like protein [Rhabdochlamydiaceae bacterium]|jgi:hypothetical protein|nr:PAAR-like protein [Rhabdochlamydiaceae bacterium]